jgi:hypothetical protein
MKLVASTGKLPGRSVRLDTAPTLRQPPGPDIRGTSCRTASHAGTSPRRNKRSRIRSVPAQYGISDGSRRRAANRQHGRAER